MELQCTYNEESVRLQKVREEYNSLKSGKQSLCWPLDIERVQITNMSTTM